MCVIVRADEKGNRQPRGREASATAFDIRWRRRKATEVVSRKRCCDLGRIVTYRISLVSLDSFETEDFHFDRVPRFSRAVITMARWRFILKQEHIV